MEVHHHSHSPRRKWTHYFWEFLMLFLAVFCGFLAEYQLEHKIERHREKQFAYSMYEDLRTDTTVLSSIIQNRNRRKEMLDSIFLLIDNPRDHLADLYFFGRHITRTAPVLFINNDRTIQQLKYSGGLRLISKQNVSNNIMTYDRQVRLVLERQENELANIRECFPYYYKIFDGRVFAKMINADNSIFRPINSPALLNFSDQDLNTFLGHCQLLNASNLANNTYTKQLKEKAIDLIGVIKKEYRLK